MRYCEVFHEILAFRTVDRAASHDKRALLQTTLTPRVRRETILGENNVEVNVTNLNSTRIASHGAKLPRAHKSFLMLPKVGSDTNRFSFEGRASLGPL